MSKIGAGGQENNSRKGEPRYGKLFIRSILETVDMECTEEKVEKGLKKCSDLLERRLEYIPTQTGKFLYFFEKDSSGLMDCRPHFQEMLDLWDVIREFADDEKFRDCEIVKAGRILDRICRACRQRVI